MDELKLMWAQRLRRMRLAKGLTQEQLALAAGVRQAKISAWELGLTAPRDNFRIALAAALDMRVCELFPYPGDEENGEAA